MPDAHGRPPSRLNAVHVRDLSAFVARQAGDTGRAPVLLDVREDWELATARLEVPGARLLHIPMSQLPARVGELDPAQPVLALCHHGMRSLQCVAWLAQQGFDHVYNVTGGIDAWSREVDPAVPRY